MDTRGSLSLYKYRHEKKKNLRRISLAGEKKNYRKPFLGAITNFWKIFKMKF